MIKILVCEDEEAISNLIKLSLTKHGYICHQAFDGEVAVDMIESKKYDLILLDIMMPKIDGYQVMEYIGHLNIPVIFITAKSSVDERVKGLRMGADDYLVKPFDIIELIARVEAVLRRNNIKSGEINIGGLSINTSSMLVRIGSETIHLTKKEYDLLLLFAQNPNMALYRETIYEKIWGEEYIPGSKTVDLHVQRLRKKIGWENCLQAVNKVGYRLTVNG